MSRDAPVGGAPQKSRQRTRIAVVATRWNEAIAEHLLGAVTDTLTREGVPADNIEVLHVPGAFEIPLAALRLAQSGRFQAVITLGAVIRGDTPHFDYVAGNCARGVARVALDTGVPVIFGVLTVDNRVQAERRMTESGAQAARAALEMVDLLESI